ncbi:MAG: PAS domain S-box protein, partial [Deltaproteobacteria bacterium]|nr:PAS domain S-box protein [Deltaproteobacteria bacterium]
GSIDFMIDLSLFPEATNIALVYSGEVTGNKYLLQLLEHSLLNNKDVIFLSHQDSGISASVKKTVNILEFIKDSKNNFSFDYIHNKFLENLSNDKESSVFIIDLSWIKPDDIKSDDIVRFCAGIDRARNLSGFYSIVLLDVRTAHPEFLIDVIKFFPWLYYSGELLENIYYIPHDVVFSPNVSRSLFDQYVNRLRMNTANKQSIELTYEEMKIVSENMRDVVFALDGSGIFKYISPSIEKSSFYSVDDLIGKPFSCFIHKDDLSEVMGRFSDVLRTGNDIIEFRVLDKNGIVRKIRVYSRVSKFGENASIVGVIRDISIEKSGNPAPDSYCDDKILKAVMDSIPTLICYIGPDGTVRYTNRAFSEFLQLSENDFTNLDFRDLVFDSISNEVKPHIERALEGKSGNYDMAFSYRGNEYSFNISYVPYFDEGKLSGFFGVFNDITEKEKHFKNIQKLEVKIRETQRMESLGVLAGGIAHDFNNLLVGILGNAGLALLELSPTNPARNSVRQIERAAIKSADLCKQMLAYSGKGRFLLHTVNISTLIDEMTHLLEASLQKNIILKYDCVENLPSVEADIGQMQQVIMNLVINAGEAIENRSGVVTISTGTIHCDRAYLSETKIPEDISDGEYVYIEVSDTGTGIEPEIREKIFDPFFTTKFTGRGLGLAAVMGIVRGHGGALKIYSEVGSGTTIKVLLPVSEKTEPASLQLDINTFEGSGTILVIDDEEWVRKVAIRTLERAGYKTFGARDGIEGLEIYKEHQSDISAVLLDMAMPHMNGREVFQELRRINPEVTVVLSSGYNERDTVNRFAGKGLAGFIQKPYHPAELLKYIESMLTPGN